MDFKEGVHKSSLRGTIFEHGREPEDEDRPRGRRRWILVVSVIVLGCLIVGGVVAFRVVQGNVHPAGSARQTGPGWCVVPVVGLHTNAGVPELRGIDAVSAQDIWMVGYLSSQNVNTANRTLIEHWDGASVSVLSAPNAGENGARLNAITEIAPDNVWAVGAVLQTPSSPNSLGDFLVGIHTLIEHWDGQAWSIVPSPDGASGAHSSNELLSIAADAADDVWVAGTAAQKNVSRALIEHWDGKTWHIVTLPASFHAAFLRGIVVPARNDVWVAGASLTPGGQELVPLLAHWDGHQWMQIPGLAKGFFLLSLRASSPHDIWLSGEIQSGQAAPSGLTVVAHWDGTSLQQQTLPKLSLQKQQSQYDPSVSLYQNQVSAFVQSLNDVWVSGGESGPAQIVTTVPVFIAHWDGQSWKAVSLPQKHAGQLSVLAVVGGKIWAAGTIYTGDQQIPAQLIETTC